MRVFLPHIFAIYEGVAQLGEPEDQHIPWGTDPACRLSKLAACHPSIPLTRDVVSWVISHVQLAWPCIDVGKGLTCRRTHDIWVSDLTDRALVSEPVINLREFSFE